MKAQRGGFHQWSYPHSWMVYYGKSHLEMDDDWGYHYDSGNHYISQFSWRVALHSKLDRTPMIFYTSHSLLSYCDLVSFHYGYPQNRWDAVSGSRCWIWSMLCFCFKHLWWILCLVECAYSKLQWQHFVPHRNCTEQAVFIWRWHIWSDCTFELTLDNLNLKTRVRYIPNFSVLPVFALPLVVKLG